MSRRARRFLPTMRRSGQRLHRTHFFYYVLNTDRTVLYERIEKRIDEMMEEGLVEEVRQLQAMGCRRDSVAMQGLGYKEILAYLNGEMSLETAVNILKRDTRHFAKRQLTWFRRERDVRFFYICRNLIMTGNACWNIFCRN